GSMKPPIEYPLSLDIINPGAETGDTTGWTTVAGDYRSLGGGTGDGTQAHSGSYFWYWGSSPYGAASQDVAINPLCIPDIDAGRLELRWEYYQCCAGPDEQRVAVEFYDNSSTLLGSSVASYSSDGGSNNWVYKSHSAAVPAATRIVRLINEGLRPSGSSNDGYNDDIAAALHRI